MKKLPIYLGGALFVTASLVYIIQLKSGEQQVDVAEPTMSFNPEKPPANVPVNTAPKQKVKNNTVDNNFNREKYAHIAERLDAMITRRPNKSFNPELVAAAVKRDTAWQTNEDIPTSLPLDKERLNDGRQFIKLDDLKIETLIPGDTVNIDISEANENYQIIVDRVEKHDYASISWYGHIEGSDGQTYDVHFTRGDSLTVGGINTPEGHFVLQGHDKDGWVASSGKLFKIDPDQPDAIYPEDI
ncbi:hypothetical protein QFX18_00985 [Saccharophagus degradans]|uniref:hypothetical protein n=1 Tax=Saccharophagus degradans TaxID=86304 RepID=UPI002478088D|nr:hypothetical protein [Saccharophagus degradans]WGO98634.1 hypothetical protein QFX18_00985 [Saccharophagus degradans]